jgi:hypothetical protein
MLDGLEASLTAGDRTGALMALAWLAGQEVDFDESELRGARRRAVQLLAAGGDPLRGFELEGRAVTALATDLDTPERREQLAAGIAQLQVEAPPLVTNALGELLADSELAWHAFAGGLLAEELDS